MGENMETALTVLLWGLVAVVGFVAAVYLVTGVVVVALMIRAARTGREQTFRFRR